MKKPGKTDWSLPDNHNVINMWPRSHNEWITVEDKEPFISCRCGWSQKVTNFDGFRDGVEVENYLLDLFLSHLNAVKHKWGAYDGADEAGKY